MNTSIEKYLKGSFVLLILFLTFFAVNLFIAVNNKPKSAYDALGGEKAEADNPKLTDTRAHNWSDLESKNKNISSYKKKKN